MASERFEFRIPIPKLLIGALLTVVPISVAGLYTLNHSQSALEKTFGIHFRTIAEFAAAEVSQFIHDRVTSVGVLATDPLLVDAVQAANRGYSGQNETAVAEKMQRIEKMWNTPAASGMVTGGRVLHHLKAFAPDPRNAIVLAGFQSGGTRGAAIAGGAESVKIHGEQVPIRAEVAMLSNLSAHADCTETLDWLRHFSRPPSKTFITHGEPAAADALRQSIEERLKWPCVVPDYLERASLA